MSIQLTQSAINRIIVLMKQDSNVYALRLSVVGGGCSGFSYNFAFETKVSDQDEVFEVEGARVLVDRVSLPLLLGATLDFKDDLLQQSFVINNPNATSSCGCGVSFSI